MLKFAWHLTLDLKDASNTTDYAFNLGAGVVGVVVGDVVGCFVGFCLVLLFFGFFFSKAMSKRIYIVIKQWPYLGI